MGPLPRALWLLVAAAVGAGAYWLSCLWLPALDLPNDFQTQWARMSEAPFAFTGQFPHRILSPLLAHLLGLDGERFFTFTRLGAVLLLAVVFDTSRWRGARPVDALLITLAVACTGAIQMYKQQCAGYVDNLGFALFLLGLRAARHRVLFWSLFLANLLNHEVAFFFTPWFLFVRCNIGARLHRELPWLLGAVALYFGFRQYVGANATNWSYNAGYFLDNTFLPYAFAWLWLLAVVHWLVRFGPLLALLVWHLAAPRPDRERWHSLLVPACALTVFFFAYDVMRHSNLLFLPLVLASARCLDGSSHSRVLYCALGLGTALVYHWFGATFDTVTSTIMFDCQGYTLILPENRFQLGQHFTTMHCVLARIWPTFLLLGAEAVALVAAGFWLRRPAGARGPS